jgi:hypothetical protein
MNNSGSTIQDLTKRLSFHKTQAKGVGSTLYLVMRHDGVDNFCYELIEYYPCANGTELEVARQYPPEQLLNITVDYGKRSQTSNVRTSSTLLKARNERLTSVGEELIIANAPRGTVHPRENRGCIYEHKARSQWIYESGKKHSKGAAYRGPSVTRTHEEAYQICVAKQNEIFHLPRPKITIKF